MLLCSFVEIAKPLAMNYVAVLVYKDNSGVYISGKMRAVSKFSQVGERGFVNMVNPHDTAVNFDDPTLYLLRLTTPDGENVYVNHTVASWTLLLGQNVPGGGGGTSDGFLEFEVSNGGGITGLPTVPIGNYLVLTALHNKQLHGLVLDGVPIMNLQSIFEPNYSPTQGRINFTGFGGLNDTSVVQMEFGDI